MSTTPARRNLVARRNAPFGKTWGFTNDDGTPFNLSGYAGTLQVRLYGGAAGDPLINLPSVTTDVEGVRVMGDAGQVQIIISKATLAALPGLNTPEAGSPQTFHYDLVMSVVSDGVWLFGTFTVYPGVTR